MAILEAEALKHCSSVAIVINLQRNRLEARGTTRCQNPFMHAFGEFLAGHVIHPDCVGIGNRERFLHGVSRRRVPCQNTKRVRDPQSGNRIWLACDCFRSSASGYTASVHVTGAPFRMN
jgi:hypothetical protein